MSPQGPYISTCLLLAFLLSSCDSGTDTMYCQSGSSGQLIINIDDQGSINVSAEAVGETLDDEAARNHIAAALGEDPCILVIIAGNPEAPDEAIDRLFGFLRENGVRNLAISMGEQ